jgi:hypothetical protein
VQANRETCFLSPSGKVVSVSPRTSLSAQGLPFAEVTFVTNCGIVPPQSAANYVLYFIRYSD